MKHADFFRVSVRALLTLVALTVTTPGLQAQGDQAAGSGITSSESSAAVQGAPNVSSEQLAESQPVLPASKRPYYHIFAAFGLAWLLVFGYTMSVRRRLAALEKEAERVAL